MPKGKLKLGQLWKTLDADSQDFIKSNLGDDVDVEAVEVVRKTTPHEIKQADIDAEERIVRRYVSTRDIDRDNEILMPKGVIIKDFKKSTRVPVLWGHDITKLLGSDNWIKADDYGVMAETKYAIPSDNSGEMGELINYVWDMIVQGHLNTSSVGFVTLESVWRGDDGWSKLTEKLSKMWAGPVGKFETVDRIVTKWMLLEHSDVAVPSNIHAVNLASTKGFTLPSECKTSLEPKPEPVITVLSTPVTVLHRPIRVIHNDADTIKEMAKEQIAKLRGIL